MEENKTLAGNDNFRQWVSLLKKEIRGAQIRAAIKVNTELLRLYWHMGAEICEKQKTATWGDGWLRELSRELTAEFPDMKGLSYRNLKYIRQWYLFYNKNVIFGQQVVAQIDEEVFFSVPWGHHPYILSQCKEVQTSKGKVMRRRQPSLFAIGHLPIRRFKKNIFLHAGQ